MSRSGAKPPPPDHAQRNRALDPKQSVLVRAPAGSGKTTLLTERFLRLLSEVEAPGQVVAITFTDAAAAEMRNRVLDELQKEDPNDFARLVLEHSKRLGWQLLDLPAQLRIQTIDSFCRDLALQQPLVSGLGGGLDIAKQRIELYRRAARRTLEQIGKQDHGLSEAIERLLLWRDNNWKEVEELLAKMLENRDQWMQDFVLDRDPDWQLLRERLERPLVLAGGGSAEGRYTDSEWEIVRACFKLLRHAAGQLRVVFSETGTVDFTEVAQVALGVLKDADGYASDAAQAVAEGIRHLLVDEFQDTSRRQHQLLSRLIGAWPDRAGRTCFVVGDPMQSIYGFREADAELFPRVERHGLEIPGELPLPFEPVQLTANFRSAKELVERLNGDFARIFADDDGSGVQFTAAEPARDEPVPAGPQLIARPIPRMQLHVEFAPQTPRSGSEPEKKAIRAERKEAKDKQVRKVVELIAERQSQIGEARAAGRKYRVAVLGRTHNALTAIAEALRAAEIPFRAVELEELAERPEIFDALALARALLNPEDRVAWLGVLRAPWCGLSLADLHTLVSADDAQLKACPAPELLASRMHLLSDEGRAGVTRVLAAAEFAKRARLAQPTVAPGTWLEQVWLRLGGAQCVDRAARANLDLLWSKIDSLTDGEQDLLGPALESALKDLKAESDPDADSDCGVYLMTIHKSKGLEFEVVIVPELQAGTWRGKSEMLSWMERGLADEDESGGVTEFLVAPLRSKGADRGNAKRIVDDARRDRERQEQRRLLYVAATRAREELHFFARPEYKTDKSGALVLAEPKNCLLATAWPAFETETRRRFEAWRARESEELVDIAAAEEELTAGKNEAGMAAIVRRLPADFPVAAFREDRGPGDSPLLGTGRLFERHEGGLLSRALGQAAHTLLQQLAQIRATRSGEEALDMLGRILPRVTAEIRAAGVDSQQAARIAEQAFKLARRAAADPIGAWILAPHPEAASEVRWTGVIEGNLRTVQVDRVFRAGVAPRAEASGEETSAWWIVDYKTAHEDGLDPASALSAMRRVFAPQVEAYGKVLRNLHGAEARIRAGLYYPRMALFDSWDL